MPVTCLLVPVICLLVLLEAILLEVIWIGRPLDTRHLWLFGFVLCLPFAHVAHEIIEGPSELIVHHSFDLHLLSSLVCHPAGELADARSIAIAALTRPPSVLVASRLALNRNYLRSTRISILCRPTWC